MSAFDLVIVPGGGVREGGVLPPWVRSRFDLAMELAADALILALSAGTPHKAPPIGDDGRPIFESVAGARYLVQSGFPADRVLVETASYDTIGNAFFARTVHAEPAGLRHVAVVTSEFHMERTAAAFNWIFTLPPLPWNYRLEYIASPDTGMPGELLAQRRSKERDGAARLAALSATYRSLPEVHRWLFTEHAAYAIRECRDLPLPGSLLESY